MNRREGPYRKQGSGLHTGEGGNHVFGMLKIVN